MLSFTDWCTSAQLGTVLPDSQPGLHRGQAEGRCARCEDVSSRGAPPFLLSAHILHLAGGALWDYRLFLPRTPVCKICFKGRHLAQWLRPCLGCMGSSPHSAPNSRFQIPANTHPGKQQIMAQVVGSLPLMWKTWIELQTLGFSLVQPQLLQTSGQGSSR